MAALLAKIMHDAGISLARLSSPGIRAARGLEAWLAADRSTRELQEGAGVFPSSPSPSTPKPPPGTKAAPRHRNAAPGPARC